MQGGFGVLAESFVTSELDASASLISGVGMSNDDPSVTDDQENQTGSDGATASSDDLTSDRWRTPAVEERSEQLIREREFLVCLLYTSPSPRD